MQWLRVLGFAFVTVSLTAGCAKGRDVKSAGKEDKLAFDEDGHGKKCDTPSSSCDEVKDPSLDFKEKCREGGFRMKQCGCENLCTGNINGQRVGYNSKNQQGICKDSKENCQVQETSAAYQDACDMTGGEMMECGCEWLCSKKLKEAIPDAPKDDEKKADVSGDDVTKKEEKPKDAKPHGNMDGKAPAETPKENTSKDKASKSSKDKSSADKSSKDKSSKDKSSSDSSGSGDKKKSGRFHVPEDDQ
jgi:hypothetical protein